MKANLLSFIRGLKNGTPPRFQSYLKSLTLLLVMLMSVNVWGEEISFIFTGTEKNCSATSGKVGNIEYESGKTGNAADCIYNTTNGLVLYYNSGDYGYFGNKTKMPSGITKILVKSNVKKNSPKYKVYGSKDKSNWTQIGSETTGGNEFSQTSTDGYLYVQIRSSASGQLGINSVIITYTAAPATPCTVTFDAGSNGTLSCPSCTEGNKLKEASAGDGVTLPNVTAEEGWKFLGWATTSGATTVDAGEAGATYKPSKDITLYAVYIQQFDVKWYVNGDLKKTDTYDKGANLHLPEGITPVSTDCDGVKVFVGWRGNTLDQPTDIEPTGIFTAASGTVTAPATYHAVFALKEGEDDEYIRVTQLSELKDGISVVLVSNKYSTALTHTATPSLSYTTAPTESSSKITATDAMKWTLVKSDTKWLIKYGDKSVGASTLPSSGNSNKSKSISFTNTYSTWTIAASTSGTNNFCFYNANTSGLEGQNSSNWIVYYNSTENAILSSEYHATKVYKSTVSYSQYVTSCVAAEVETPTITTTAEKVQELYWDQIPISMACETSGAEIYYTTDGVTEPTKSSTKYNGPFNITATTTIKAKAFVGSDESYTATQTFTFGKVYADVNAYLTDKANIADYEKIKINYLRVTITSISGSTTVNFSGASLYTGSSVPTSPTSWATNGILVAKNQIYTARVFQGSSYQLRPSSWNVLTYVTNLPNVTGLNATNITSNSVTLEWTAVTNAGSYKVKFNNEEKDATTETSMTISDLNYNTQYSWYVKALTSDLDVATDGNYGSAKNFTTLDVPHKVTFHAGDKGTCATESLTETATGAGVILPEVTNVATGYDFKGWSSSPTPTSANAGAAGANYKPADDIDLYAYYTPQIYDIAYQDKGGVDYSGSNLGLLPKKHTYNAETQLTDGVKTGYHFDGWFEDAACEGTPIEKIAGDAKTTSFTLYAKWTEILPESFQMETNEITLVWDDNNNNIGYVKPIVLPTTAANLKVSYSAKQNDGVVEISNVTYEGVTSVLKITAKKEGTAIYEAECKGNSSLPKQTITIIVKRLPVLTWKDANGDVVATTKATALNNGKVVLPKEVDYSKTPATCNDEYDHFMGWSATQFNATTDNPTLVKDGDEVNSDSETGDKTYYAVFAKGTGSPVEWNLCSTVNDVTAGTYVITWDNSYYLPSETTATSNPAVGSGITVNDQNKLSCTITDAMQWTFAGDNTNGWKISHTFGQKTYYVVSTNTAQGISVVDNSTTNGKTYTWLVSVDNTYGMLLNGTSISRYLSVYNSSSWRYYVKGNDYKGTMRLYKKSGGIEYHDFLTSCCQGYNVTLANEGTATGGTFSADVESACEGETVTLTATPATGYEFVQWTVKSDDEQTSYSVTDNKFEMPANGVKVSALFGKINYTVSLKRNFESTDDTYTTETFTYQETKALTTMATIGWTKTNYKFSGWSTTPSGSVEYVDGAEYKLEEAQNKTLYAIWTADDAQPISISQEHMTLTNAPTSISAAATQLKIDYSVATGYKITNVEVTVGGQPLSTIVYTQYQLVVNASDGFQGAVNITFTVEEILYTVIIDAGTGQCSTSEVVQSAYNTNITLPAASTVTAPADWEFAGWCATQITEQTDVVPILLLPESAYKPTENTTIYAVYKQSKGDGGEETLEFTPSSHEGWTVQGTNNTSYYLLGKQAITSPQINDLSTITSISAKVGKYSNKGAFTIKAGTYSIASQSVPSSTDGNNYSYKSTDQNWPTMTGSGSVELKNTDGSSGSSGSRVFSITIKYTTPCTYYYHSTPNVVVEVEVKTIATKNTRYKEGDMFNADGIVLTATYQDATQADITEGFTWNLTEALTPANTEVVFTYKNVSTEPTAISVGTLDHIGLIQQPTKKEYTEGEDFDSKGISVRAYYSNGAYQSVTSEVTYEPSTNLQVGTTQITVYYLKGNPKEKTCTIEGITVKGKVATPIITPASGKVSEETTVTITCTTPEATIYYTTDNTTPTTSSNEYSSSFKVDPGTTVRAYAVREGWTDSEVAKAVYAEQPVFDQGDWILVTDPAELTAGSYVIIANADYKFAMKSYVSGDYCATETATISEDGSMLTYNVNFGVFELREYKVENEVKGISFFDYAKEQYLYYSGSSNTLKAQDNQDATAAWTFSQSENDLLIKNYTSTARKIQFNSSATPKRFACYTATQNEVQLYKYYKKVPKLIYDANGGENAPVPTRTENGVATVTDKTPTWGGYEFVKWTADKEGKDKEYTAGEEVAITTDITIYAQWQEKQLEGTPVAFVVQYGEKYYAMGKDLSAVEVEGIYNGNVVVVSEEIDQKAITWYRKDVEGGVTFQNCEEMYLQGASSTNLELVEDITEATTWNWDNENQYYYTTIAGTKRSFFSQNRTFKNYAVSNIGTGSYSSAATCCTSFRVGEVFTRDMTNGFMGTHCYPFDIAAGDYKGARFYEIAYRIGDTRIYFDQVDHVEAGVPYLVVPEENGSILEAIVTPKDVPAGTSKGFIGSYTQEQITKNENYYIVYNNEFRRVGNNVSVGANRAYIDLTQVTEDDPQAGNPKAPARISLRNSEGATPTGINNIREEFGNPNGAMKIFHENNIYILREGNVYNGQGLKLK